MTKCPHCQTVMNREIYEGLELDRCEACAGVWVTQPYFGLIVRRKIERFTPEVIAQARRMVSAHNVPDVESARLLFCPECGEKLATFLYNYNSGIVLSRCYRGHGLYLDHGELEVVQAHAELLDAAMDGLFAAYVENPNAVFDAPDVLAEDEMLTDAEREAAPNWRETPPAVKERFLTWLDKLFG